MTVRAGALAGVLFGLAVLTRTWALALVVASCLALRSYRRVSAALALAGILVVFTVPWFAHQTVSHGNLFAFNRPASKEAFFSRRPASFYTSLDVDAVFSRPYAPHYLNHLWPVVYTDWWGDYWRYFELPYENISTPPELPPRYENPRVRQSYVGLAPSLLAVAGFVGLLVIGIRRRAPALLVLPAAVVLLGAAFLVFQVSYPHPDGDTIKATYLLDAAAPLAVCASLALSSLRRLGGPVMIVALLLLAYISVLDIVFLVLPA